MGWHLFEACLALSQGSFIKPLPAWFVPFLPFCLLFSRKRPEIVEWGINRDAMELVGKALVSTLGVLRLILMRLLGFLTFKSSILM